MNTTNRDRFIFADTKTRTRIKCSARYFRMEHNISTSLDGVCTEQKKMIIKLWGMY